MTIEAIKGAILEELVLYLLTKVGYRVINPKEEGTRQGGAGLEVQGRGEWHQIDAFAAYDYTPAFMYPLRLMIEAKCYDSKSPIRLPVVRNAVGTLKDISENYFAFPLEDNSESEEQSNSELKMQRFNYLSAIFSTSGFTKRAQRYAMAHQIFLIQYDNVPIFQIVSDGLNHLNVEHFNADIIKQAGINKEIRAFIRTRLYEENTRLPNLDNNEFLVFPHKELPLVPFTRKGGAYLNHRILVPLRGIGGSYFGMLQGKWPIHLLSKNPLPPEMCEESDILKCRVSRSGEAWGFEPSISRPDSPNWFRLEFDLPEEIAAMVRLVEGDREKLASLKKAHFSFITISGEIGNIHRQIRLELDMTWLSEYLQRPAGETQN